MTSDAATQTRARTCVELAGASSAIPVSQPGAVAALIRRTAVADSETSARV